MKIVCYLVLFLIVASCSTTKPKKIITDDAPEKSELPEWVVNPEKGCIEKFELCASSEANTLSAADMNARKALASIFETKISADFQMKLRSVESKNSSFKIQKNVKEDIDESVEGVLKGVEIKKRFEQHGIYFSLANLNKEDAATLFEREIHLLDEQILYYLKQRKRSMYQTLLINAEKREELYQKFLLVSERKIEPPYTAQDIENLRYVSNEKKRISIRVTSDLSRELKTFIENTLTKSGYEITEDNDYFYIVTLKWRKEPLKMNVGGFKKVNFTLEVDVRDNSYRKVGGSLISETGTGRSEEQAFISVKELIKRKFSESLAKLNMY